MDFLKNYLFIYLAVSGLSCGMWDLCFGMWDLFFVACRLFVVACRLLSSCGPRALEREGSVVVARGLSCPEACGILVPRPGIEPASPALEGRFLTTGPPGKSQEWII